MKNLQASLKGICFLLACLVATPGAYGQQDARANKYLDAAASEFEMDKGYYLEIDYVREDLMQETEVKGYARVWMKGLKYKMVADEFIIYFDGKKLFSQDTLNEEVYVSEPDPDRPGYFQAVPIGLFRSYKSDFKYMFLGELPFMGQQMAEIQLYPLVTTGTYAMLKLYVHPTTLTLEALQVKHKEGILYTMIFKKKNEVELDDSKFSFDPAAFPDTEIIELLE